MNWLCTGKFRRLRAASACRARRPRRAALQGFRPAGRVTLPSAAKKPKRRWGRGRRALRAHRTAFPRPHCGERVPAGFCSTSGAQNLSGGPRFLPAHWGLALRKLLLVRFHDCAWVSEPTKQIHWRREPQGAPLPDQGPFLETRRGRACPSCRPSELHLSPTTTKARFPPGELPREGY